MDEWMDGCMSEGYRSCECTYVYACIHAHLHIYVGMFVCQCVGTCAHDRHSTRRLSVVL